MAPLRRDRGHPSEDGRPAGKGSNGPSPQSGWVPGRAGEAGAAWPGPQPQHHQWPVARWPETPPGSGPAPQPTPQASYPAWPAAHGATDPEPTAQEDAIALAAAEAAEAARVVGGNGHLDGFPLGRVKVIERFQGPRLKHRTTVWRRLRSLALLMLVGLVMAAVLAAVLALIVWGISTGVHAATSG